MATQILAQLAAHDITGETVRVVDHCLKPGVELDMGTGDDWPSLREKIMKANVVIFATPTWLGQPSSVCQRVLERLDAELSENDEQGRPHTYGKVALAAVVGNEDGAHHIVAVLFQCLNDVGFTIPAGGATYWNGEALHRTDYNDLDETPESVESTMRTMAANAAHLASFLAVQQYPPLAS
jgi:multimeric flavodoxin WrbA